VTNQDVARAQSLDLARSIERVEELAAAQRITQESMDDLARAIADLPVEGRGAVVNFLSGLSSSVWATVLLQAVNMIAK